MNTAKLKKYAPQARRQFISAVSKQLNQLGIYSESQISQVKDEGSLLVIDGKTFDVKIKSARSRLVKKIQQIGYNQLVEQVAYTWFNRLCAIRYMEIHNYFEHGFRVLSHPSNPKGFEILEHAQDAAAELGLNRESIIQLKLAGNKDEELYRELLLGQCHKLHEAMPFLFDALDDETELLLPDNLIRTDSILRGLVDDVSEEDWRQVEVIGWLYQFYISEKKDQVIGKVVKSEDIPAATQLFTPNWIVKYLVQNSVGRLWLETYPNSAIKKQMSKEFYVEPAQQSDEVFQQIRAITRESLDPETIKVLDPACGSGHILIEAYNVLKAIYEERGFRSRDIPKMILENNIYGLDIDDRAAQLSGFALMMMARNDDKRIFTRNVRLNVMSLQESNHFDLQTVWKALNLSGSSSSGTSHSLFDDEEQDISSFNADNRYQLLKRILAKFTHAKTFGSLIDVSNQDHDKLKDLLNILTELQYSGDSMQKPAAKQLVKFVHQALVLSIRYDAVIANPPYMGGKGMNAALKDYAKKQYPNSKSDLFAIFMERAFSLLSDSGFNAQINMQSWMFLSSYEQLRRNILEDSTLITMAHLGARAFSQISGEIVQTTAWIIQCTHINGYQPTFFRLVNGNEEDKRTSLLARDYKYTENTQENLEIIPGSPIAYWVTSKFLKVFDAGKTLRDYGVNPATGLQTGDNKKFIRYWFEISNDSFGKKWIPLNDGGEVRRWYGNFLSCLNWENDGQAIKNHNSSVIRNPQFYLREGATWNRISSGLFAVRYLPEGFIFDQAGDSLFTDSHDKLLVMIGFLNSPIGEAVMKIICPTLNATAGSLELFPFPKVPAECLDEIKTSTSALIDLAKKDWDSYEISWNFKRNPLVSLDFKEISDSYSFWFESCVKMIEEAKSLEEKNNRFFIDLYGLQDEFKNEIHLKDITLFCNKEYRYDFNIKESELGRRLCSDTICELVSYSIGCIMGRFSLEQDGLVSTVANNSLPQNVTTVDKNTLFQPDEDGIIPLTDQEWFKDDATNRFREFVQVVWGHDFLQKNLDFVAESLCLNAIKPKKSESALDTIRRYLSVQFYKDHLKTYKNRPIYWLFSSGKQKAFECLVYLHRYNDGTLSRMRTEYVTPLLGKYDAFAQRLEQQIDSTDATSEKNQLKKELDNVIKKQVELREFDDKLKHFADMRISLDLDDGVRVNYGKFGDLLADVKAITGSAAEGD